MSGVSATCYYASSLERGVLVFHADYVRGRMMKTTATVGPDGKLLVETRNRHEMALRWLRPLKGEKHIQLAAEAATHTRRD